MYAMFILNFRVTLKSIVIYFQIDIFYKYYYAN